MAQCRESFITSALYQPTNLHTQSPVPDSAAKVFRATREARDNASVACVENRDYATGTKHGATTPSHESYFMLQRGRHQGASFVGRHKGDVERAIAGRHSEIHRSCCHDTKTTPIPPDQPIARMAKAKLPLPQS